MDAHPEVEMLPGTRRVLATADSDSLLKQGEILLVPHPTDSPNDPLNWSLWRKIWHSVLVCYVVALTAATSNVAGSASDGVNTEYGISYDVFNTGAGVLFVAIGYWTLLSSPAVHLYGRRVLYLVGMVWGLIGNIWFGRLTNSADTIWSQLFVGASESVAEAVVQVSLLDVWFEHQNGTSLAAYTLATTIGTYVGPLIAGYVADSDLGWRWIGYLGTISSGFTFLLLFFGLEETSFSRERYIGHGPRPENGENKEQKQQQEDQLDGSNDEKLPEDGTDVERTASAHSGRQRGFSLSYTQPKTYWERIAVITAAPNLRGFGFKQYLHRLWHTMRVFTFPAVWFAGLQWGMQNVALTFYLTVEEDYWIEEPWNYGDAAVGNMNLPCLIGSVIGCLYGGYFSDKFVIWMSRRRGGVVESEFRLWIMSLCAAVFPAGMLIFGIGSAGGWSWPAPYVGLGFIGFGYGCAGDLSLTYLADSYPEMILEGMVGVAVINNSMALIFTFVASYWLDTGLRNCFIELGVLGFVIVMLFLPMALYGKRARRWTLNNYVTFLRIRDGMDQ